MSFNIVAQTRNVVRKSGNNVEATFDFVEKTKFTINSFDIDAVFGNKVECCFDKVQSCFDIVAGVDGAYNEGAG